MGGVLVEPKRGDQPRLTSVELGYRRRLSRAGYSREESEFYGPAVERGGVLVAVDTEDVSSANQVGEILAQQGGPHVQPLTDAG